MTCHCPNMLFMLLAFFRIIGAFPYRWKWETKGIEDMLVKFVLRQSVVAVVWSWVVVMFLVTLSLSCVINAPNFNRGITSTITIYILNFVSYITAAILFTYLATNSSKLANIIRRLDQAGAGLRRPLVQRNDAMQLVCGAGMVASLAYATYASFRGTLAAPLTKSGVLYHLPATTCDIAIETSTLALGLSLYFVLKIVSTEIREAVEVLVPQPHPYHLTSNWVNGFSTKTSLKWKILPHSHHTAALQAVEEQEGSGGGVVGEVVRCRVSRRLLALDDIVVDVVQYAGPPAAMILLASTVNATVMLYLTITNLRSHRLDTYYVAYITTKILSVIQITFVPDCLSSQREKCLRLVRGMLASHDTCTHTETGLRDVERILSTGAKFLVCRLFTLDRHIILSVASSVVTYLVIALQFGLSETPQQTEVNCTMPENT